LAQRFPLDERHHVVEEAVRLSRIEQREDVGMLQLGSDLDLAEEPLRAQGRGQFRFEDLHGHFALVPQVLGQVHRGHPAAAELALDRVTTRKGRSEERRVGKEWREGWEGGGEEQAGAGAVWKELDTAG